MAEKPGRNDPCPCGSGKKFKQCCLNKIGSSGIKKKIQAVWVNKPAQDGVNLMERTFGNAIAETQTSASPSFLTSSPTPEESTSTDTDRQS